MLEKEPVRYHEKNGIARISFDRPEALNAMNKELLQKLASVLDKAKVDGSLVFYWLINFCAMSFIG